MHEPKNKVAALGRTGGESLCFDKNEFMKANFSVDEFLHKNRTAPSLEQLRDNLGLYLKGLRASMIDLINEDYADFVSLSANLIGLDQSIEVIQHPLEVFRDEIVSIQTLIQENEDEIRSHLERKCELREIKRNLQSLKKVYETIGKLESLISNRLSENLKPVDLERAALELIQLKFNEQFCAEYLQSEQKSSIANLQGNVLTKLRLLFNETLKSSTSTSSEPLERCLRIYITLDSCQMAEHVFREDVVAPYMSDIISEHSLQNSPQGLAGIYSKILNFISLHMTDLLRLTQYTDKLHGFNFVVNSFWADVEMRLETHMTSIFAPGNSQVFYAKYKCTRDFLAKIEELLSNETAVCAFRQHKQTKSFQARWNLPVYFQICFQEIAGQFESKLEPLLQPSSLHAVESATHFHLTPFTAAQKAIECCWADDIYLSEVFPKFFKLNIQIMLRLSHWISDVIVRTGTKADLPAKLNKSEVLIALHADIERFLALIPQMQDIIFNCIPKEKQVKIVHETLIKSFADLQQMLNAHLRSIQSALVSLLITESGLENVRQVSDLPRLYRKTNREAPTRSSTYVEQMLRPLKAFGEQQHNRLGKAIVEQVLAQVCSKITTDYFTAVADVLTSVQKTEESLRRLRSLKSGVTATTTVGATTVSDDDKIRMQLRVDVAAWTAGLAKLHLMPSEIDKLLDLNSIVEESIKVKELTSI